MSKLQGQIAGLSILQNLGYLSDTEARQKMKTLTLKLMKEQRFSRMLRDRLQLRPGLLTLIEPETFVCRCEMVTAGQIEAAIKEGARDLRGIKLRTRCGMGACQGRYCESNVRALVAAATNASPESVGQMTVRPPLISLQIQDLIAKTETETTR